MFAIETNEMDREKVPKTEFCSHLKWLRAKKTKSNDISERKMHSNEEFNRFCLSGEIAFKM